MVNKNMIIMGDFDGTLKQWKMELDNLTLVSKKENAFDILIYELLNIRNGFIPSFSDDNQIKIL